MSAPKPALLLLSALPDPFCLLHVPHVPMMRPAVLQVGQDPARARTQPLKELPPGQDSDTRDLMKGTRLALTNALKDLLQVRSLPAWQRQRRAGPAKVQLQLVQGCSSPHASSMFPAA